MRARVYGAAFKSSRIISEQSYRLFDGQIVKCYDQIKETGNYVDVVYEGEYYKVYSKQLETIREITITEEDFDKLYEKLKDAKGCVHIKELKEELFKDVK